MEMLLCALVGNGGMHDWKMGESGATTEVFQINGFFLFIWNEEDVLIAIPPPYQSI